MTAYKVFARGIKGNAPWPPGTFAFRRVKPIEKVFPIEDVPHD